MVSNPIFFAFIFFTVIYTIYMFFFFLYQLVDFLEFAIHGTRTIKAFTCTIIMQCVTMWNCNTLKYIYLNLSHFAFMNRLLHFPFGRAQIIRGCASCIYFKQLVLQEVTGWSNTLTDIHCLMRVRASHHRFLHQSCHRSRWHHCREALVGCKCCSCTSSHLTDTLNACCSPTHLKRRDTGAGRHKRPTQSHTRSHPHTSNLQADILMA